MGNCTNSKKRIPIPPRKGSSSLGKKILLGDSKKEGNKFKRSLSKEESSIPILINKNSNNNSIKNKDNNNNRESISSISKPKIILIKFNNNNKSYNGGLIKSKSKEKVIHNLKNYHKNNANKGNSCAKIKYIHIKNRSSSSTKYDLVTLNNSINNNTCVLKDKNNGKTIANKVNKSGCKCKSKYKIPRSTFESNNSNNSSSTRNCKIKSNKIYCNTINVSNDENIDIINKNFFNIYNNENANINLYKNKYGNLENSNNNSNKNNNNNKEIYKCIKTIEGHQEKIV